MTWKGWIICALVSIGMGFWLADFMSPENRQRATAEFMAESSDELLSDLDSLAAEQERLSDRRDEALRQLRDLDRRDALARYREGRD